MKVSTEFANVLGLDTSCIDEAERLVDRLAALGLPVAANHDHVVIACDRVATIAQPLIDLGYVIGSDGRAYPGLIDGREFIAVAAGLRPGAAARSRGWFEYAVLSQPVTPAALAYLMTSASRPFVHHACIGLSPPLRKGRTDIEYAVAIMALAFRARREVARETGEPQQRLTMSLPEAVVSDPRFADVVASAAGDPWSSDDCAVEIMDGGGFMLQFPASSSYRVEVMVREGTRVAFNNDAAAQLATRLSYAQGGRR